MVPNRFILNLYRMKRIFKRIIKYVATFDL